MENENKKYEITQEEIQEAKKELAAMIIKEMSPAIAMEFLKLGNKLKK